MIQQIPLPLPHEAAMGADDFLVTPCNEQAVAWINKWPAWAAPGLVIAGPAGSGKTHLLNLWLHRSKGRLVSAQEIGAEDVSALRAASPSIAIDDAEKLASNAKTEENLFHLYNHLQATKGFLVLAMSKTVGQAGFVLPDLRSRLLTLPSATLLPPDDRLIEALIVKQFRDRQLTLDPGVVSYLTTRLTRDTSTIRTMVEKLDQASLAQGRKITIALARQMMEDKDAS